MKIYVVKRKMHSSGTFYNYEYFKNYTHALEYIHMKLDGTRDYEYKIGDIKVIDYSILDREREDEELKQTAFEKLTPEERDALRRILSKVK